MWPTVRPHIIICLDGLVTTRNLSLILDSAPAEVRTEQIYRERSRLNKPTGFNDANRRLKLQSVSGNSRLPTPIRSPFTIQTVISNDKISTGTLNFTEKAIKVECAVSMRYVYSRLQISLRD
jgi:hypothetical protein